MPLRSPAVAALFASMVAAPLAASAQDVTISIAPSSTSTPAGSLVTIDLEYQNSDAPNTGIAALNLVLSVSGPGTPIVVGNPAFPGGWPITFGQTFTNVVQDGAGGFERITGVRFDDGTPPLVNPPVVFTYDLFLPQSGTYVLSLAPLIGQGTTLNDGNGSFPTDPASVTLNGAVIQAGPPQPCGVVETYAIEGSVTIGSRDQNNGSDREYTVAFDLAAIDPAMNAFDVILRDPLGNTFDGASSDPALAFETEAELETYLTTTVAQPGWTIDFADQPTLGAARQIFPIEFSVSPASVQAFLADLPELTIDAPTDTDDIPGDLVELSWTLDPAAAPDGFTLFGEAFADGAGNVEETLTGLAPTDSSAAFSSSFNPGNLFLSIAYQSPAAAINNTGILSAAVNAPCSTTGQAGISSVQLDARLAISADVEPTVVDVPGCNDADLAPPFGVLDLADTDVFIIAFLAGDPVADLVPPFGIIDLDDFDAFIVDFLAGCF